MSISKVNFQVYADGKKRILVVENCEGETLAAFNHILESICGLPEAKMVPAVTEEPPRTAPSVKKDASAKSFGFQIPDTKTNVKAESPELHFPDILLISGDYAGMTPYEAFERDGIRAVPILCDYSKDLEPERIRKHMIECCKHLIALDLAARSDKTNDIATIIDFFSVYRQLLGNKCLQAIHNDCGMELDEAIKNKNCEILSQAYMAVISDLKNRTKA